MKHFILLSFISLSFLAISGCCENNTQNSAEDARFIVLDEFYILEGDSTKTKLIKNKKTSQCFLLKQSYYIRSSRAGVGEYLSPASCDSTSTFIVLDEFYILEGDSTKTKLIKNKKTSQCFLLKQSYYIRSSRAGVGEYLSLASCKTY